MAPPTFRPRHCHTTERGSLLLRSAEADDAPALRAYFQAGGFESQAIPAEASAVAHDDEARDRPAQEIEYVDALFLIAVCDGDSEIVGALTFSARFTERTRQNGEIGVTVRADRRGEGIGRALIEALLDWAMEGHVTRQVELRVGPDNRRAIALYKSLGFTEESDGGHPASSFTDRPKTRLMVRRLGPEGSASP